MKKIALFQLLLALGNKSIGQSVLIPQNNAFEQHWLHNTEYTMQWYFEKDTGKIEIGTVGTRIMMNDSYITVITNVRMRGTLFQWIDSTIAETQTLYPVYHASYNKQRDMVLHFGKIVTGYYYDKSSGTTTYISDTTKEAYFDSNIYPQLLGWLPLQEGYKKDIAIYDYNPSAATGVLRAHVISVTSGTITSRKSGTHAVWMVTVSDDIGNRNNGSSLYYFDQKDRKLWKQEILLGGRRMIMERVE